jgi:hypothetical protein
MDEEVNVSAVAETDGGGRARQSGNTSKRRVRPYRRLSHRKLNALMRAIRARRRRQLMN